MDITQKTQQVLEEYHRRLRAEQNTMSNISSEEGYARRDEFLLPVGEVVGKFVHDLVVGHKAKNILEIGTSYGYSTLWLASAASKTGGSVISLEKDQLKAQYAASKIKEAGLEKFVEFRIEDALDSLHSLATNFDFVLLDIWKELYVQCYTIFKDKLNPGAYIVADNILFPKTSNGAIKEYVTLIKSNVQFDSVLLPIGSGIEISHFRT